MSLVVVISRDLWTYKLPRRKMKVIASFFHRCICSFQRDGIGRMRIAMLVRMSGGEVP